MRKILTQFVILRRSLTQFLSSWAEDLPRSFHHKQNTYPVYFITSRRLIQFLLKWLEDLSRFLSSWAETCPVPLIMIRILTQFLSSWAGTYPVPFIILSRILTQFLSSSWAEYLPISFHLLEEKSYPVPFIIRRRAPKNVPAVPSPWTPIESTVNQRLEPDIWNMLHKHYIS